ncbi:MAG TPA: ribosome-associated translation inhibitor RaiA [Hyphomonadaceae bacterium]|nr:ribosome-associated translation inhibitor RaiA [Hyphomonadaceae bacterium]HPI48962.1 ribosome-associated translation inhibitor RaiA [Hyphomonadaceae bacterium]HPN07532.1 ribosome-associated translation inhibitor RaiA [Hyphomonadaceae bacterium]
MQVQIAGKKIEVGAALQERISFGLENRVSKYFNRTGEAFVTVSKPGWAFNVDCSIHLPSGVTLQAHGEGDDGYQAFEMALDKIEKRVRRYKNRLRDHRASNGTGVAAEIVSERIILPRDETNEPDEEAGLDAAAGDSPAIVAESDMKIRTMTVSMAVMQLELADSPALLFRNAAHGRLNMVYRRHDGNVGWVDPGKDS